MAWSQSCSPAHSRNLDPAPVSLAIRQSKMMLIHIERQGNLTIPTKETNTTNACDLQAHQYSDDLL